MPCTSAVPRFCELGIRPIRLEMSGTKEPLFSFFMDHIDELFEIYNAIDQQSQNSLLGYILGLISNDFSFYRFSETNEYILREFIPQPNEIVIDGGSADGATAAMFKDLGCQVYSFEIDHENFKIASKLASEKNFTIENLGLSDFARIATYHAGKVDLYGKTLDSAEEVDANEIMETRLISIDEYVREKNLPRVDLIKLNIMGAELQALRGATTTISRFKPKLMINTYLPPIQLFDAFKLLRALCPDYKFACRQWTGSFENYSKMFDSQLLKYIEKYNLPRKWFHISGLMLFAR